MNDERAWVVSREALGGEYYRLRLRPAEPFSAVPGQFAMVRVGDGLEPLLRRPFSLHRVDRSGEFELMFRVVGGGTRRLARARVGDRLDVLAPLGRGFDLADERPVLVGGGVGVAPLLFLAEALLDRGLRPTLLLGGRTDRDLLCHDDFRCLAVPYRLATEDGSLGEAGRVTRLLQPELTRGGEAPAVYACGPAPMLAAVAALCRGRAARCQVSLEASMACGIGACLGCVAPRPGGGYLRVCKEGPVFDAGQVAWDAPEETPKKNCGDETNFLKPGPGPAEEDTEQRR